MVGTLSHPLTWIYQGRGRGAEIRKMAKPSSTTRSLKRPPGASPHRPCIFLRNMIGRPLPPLLQWLHLLRQSGLRYQKVLLHPPRLTSMSEDAGDRSPKSELEMTLPPRVLQLSLLPELRPSPSVCRPASALLLPRHGAGHALLGHHGDSGGRPGLEIGKRGATFRSSPDG